MLAKRPSEGAKDEAHPPQAALWDCICFFLHLLISAPESSLTSYIKQKPGHKELCKWPIILEGSRFPSA